VPDAPHEVVFEKLTAGWPTLSPAAFRPRAPPHRQDSGRRLPNHGKVDVTLLTQPYRGSGASTQTFLATALGDPGVDDVLIVVAWIRESGMSLLVPGLEALRQRGGTARLLFGVDLKGTSRQGVELARRHFTQAYAVHDPSGRTFHPKLYLAKGATIGYALVGSSNLTAGGLWHNYESGLSATFDPSREPGLADSIEGYAQRLLDDRAICKRVTRRVFDRLVRENWLADEAADRRHRREDRAPREGGRGAPSGSALFTASNADKRGRPAPTTPSVSTRRVPKRTRRGLATAPDSWGKPLGTADAQQLAYGHPTGYVELTHVPRDQDAATFFRTVFFAGERWRRGSGPGKATETATIEADVEIDGHRLGSHRLVVAYRPHRRERGRATTVLRWGDALLAELRRRDVSGRYILIERADLGAYRIQITPDEPD